MQLCTENSNQRCQLGCETRATWKTDTEKQLEMSKVARRQLGCETKAASKTELYREADRDVSWSGRVRQIEEEGRQAKAVSMKTQGS